MTERKFAMKPGIALTALEGKSWIGGVYYVRNMAFQLSQNQSIREKYGIYIITDPQVAEEFAGLPECVKIITLKNTVLSRIWKWFIYKAHNIRYLFPIRSVPLSRRDPSLKELKLLGITPIYWIPDFQHNRLPELFSQEELADRNRCFSAMGKPGNPLVLSSQDALTDFREFYFADKKDVAVIPFVSYLAPIIQAITEETRQEILDKFQVSGKRYVCIMNQFWKHKNHLVVLQAMKKLFEADPDNELLFLFTGKLSDYRDPAYIEQLKEMMADPVIAGHIRLLGFIEREEQLVLMQNAEFIIQPSLFEGWGTVLEDAKVLDKTVLLSDISIHREQKSEKCVLFDPYDPDKLALLIREELKKEHKDDLEAGIADMYARAKEYARGFASLLDLN